MSKPTRPADARLPAYTPAEIAEQDAARDAAREAEMARVDRWLLACEHDDAEGEAY